VYFSFKEMKEQIIMLSADGNVRYMSKLITTTANLKIRKLGDK